MAFRCPKMLDFFMHLWQKKQHRMSEDKKFIQTDKIYG